MDTSLSKTIADAIEKATEKAMERLATNIFESLARILSIQLTRIVNATASHATLSQDLVMPMNKDIQISSANQESGPPCAGSSKQLEHDPPELHSDNSDEMDIELLKTLKRSRSPLSHKISARNTKSKKYLSKKNFFENLSKSDFLKDDILDQAVSAAGIPSQ